MSVSDGQSVNAATVNAAFVSKSADSTMTGKLDVTNTTDATGITDGAIHTDGGMGVEKSLHVGTTINATGNINAGANVVVTGDVSANDATLTGNLGAVNATISGDLGALNVNATTTTTTNLFATTSSIGTASANSLSTATVTTTGNVVIGGDLTVSGTSTTVNSATLEITDASVLVNNGGSDATSEGAGLEIERTTTNAAIKFEDALTSKFKAGLVGSEVELANVSGSQTLTNKTIDSDNNTITNIVNADIKASAGIALDKLAATTASRALASDASGFVTASATTSTELGYVSGVTSAIQTQINSKIATADAVDIISTQLITGEKRFQNAIRMDEWSATPSTPAAGTQYIYPKDDNVWYTLNSAGVETPLGSGGGSGAGGINFIEQYTFDNAIGDWATYADAAGTTPVDGTGGTADSTLSRLKIGSINGSSLRLTKNSGSSRQGEGFSVGYEVGGGFRTHAMQLRFYYKVYSGTYTDDAIRVYIYDIANATLIEPSNFKLKNHSLDSVEQICEFQNNYQTGINAGKYRVCFHIAGTDTNAYDLLFDYITIGPPAKVLAPVITDWKSYTPAFTGTTNGSAWTNSAVTGYWRRVGDSIEVSIYTGFSGAPGTGTGNFQWALPSGYSIDTTKLPVTTTARFGFGQPRDGTTTFEREIYGVTYASSTTVTLNGRTDAGSSIIVNPTTPFTIDANSGINLHFKVPILGWSSGLEIGDNYSGREIAARVTRATAQTIATATATKIQFNAKTYDTISAFDATTNYRYDVKTSGTYRVIAKTFWDTSMAASANVFLFVYKNGSLYSTLSRLSGVVNFSQQGSDQLSLVAGDYVEIYTQHSNGSNADLNDSYFTIEKLASPAAIASGEKVAARYTTNAGQSIADVTTTVILFEDKDFDTHGAYNTSSGMYTAPIAGFYKIDTKVTFNDTASGYTYEKFIVSLYKNSVEYLGLGVVVAVNAANEPTTVVGSDTIFLIAGDTIDIRAYISAGASTTLFTSGIWNSFSITKL